MNVSFNLDDNEVELIAKKVLELQQADSDLINEKLDKIYEAILNIDSTSNIDIEQLAQAISEKISCNNSENPNTPELPQTEDISIIPATSRFAGLKTAAEIVNAISVGWNLAGTLEAVGGGGDLAQETSWGQPKATQELFDAVAAKGFNAVRIPVTWSQHIDWSTGTISSAWMARVEEVVNYALKNDLIVILNTHHDHSSYMHANGNFKQWLVLDPDKNTDVCNRLASVWTQIAEHFKSYDGRLIFEGWNEVQHTNQDWVTATDEEWNSLNTMAKVFVDTVRATKGNNSVRCLLINPPMTSDKNMVEKMVLPTDVIENRIIISGHPYDSRYGEELEDRFPNWDKMIEKGIPVIFGEVGTTAEVAQLTRERNALNYTARGKKHGIPMFWWDDEDRMLINRGDYTWYQESIVDNLIKGATSDPEEIMYTAVYNLNDISYWESGKIDPDTGEKVTGKNNSKVLKERVKTSEGHVENITVKSYDNGFQLWTIAFYDSDGNYVYGIYKPSMYNVSFVCPTNAVSFNITVWNPWGVRSDSQWSDYFANSQLSIIIKEEETTLPWEDERLHVYDFAEVDLNDFSNWRIGEYEMSGNYSKSAVARICVKGHLKVDSDLIIENEITNADGTSNQDVRLVLRTYDSNHDIVENLGAWQQGVMITNGSHGVELGVSMYYPKNSTVVIDNYKALFESGLNIKINTHDEFKFLTLSGSDCLKGRSVNKLGNLIENANSYRALPLFDVSDAGRELAVIIKDNTWRFCEFNEDMNVIKYQETGAVNKVIMQENTKYIRISGSSIDAASSIKVAYTGEIVAISEETA
ncbi:MAG: glycoside hydrolase family 5 protein [bacterium]|nr:glycoside hydrolase family 5 protein [bacterium]